MNFLKTFLAVILGVFVAFGLFVFVFFGIIGSMMPAEEQVVVEPSSVLRIDLSESISERTLEEPFDFSSLMPSMLSSGATTSLGIYDAVRALDAAATDSNIKFIYISASGASAPIAYLEEMRSALERCKAAGKAIIAYGMNFSTGEYYLASVADKIYADEFASNGIIGTSTTIIFLKDILDRLGVNVQLIRHGKYKSAGEQFIAKNISEANREQNEAMVNALWKTVSDGICSGRGIDAAKLDRMVDNLEISTVQQMKEAGLVDSICTLDAMKNTLASLSGKDEYDDINMLGLGKYAKAAVKNNYKAKDKVAILYADGQINNEGEGITYQSLVPEIENIRKDESVKAVVLRVNSPGGSVQPAEIIRTELELLQAEKPLIVSYGTMAASGGYWISAGADKIYSNNSTLTGSIGVFSMIPSGEKVLREKLHVNPVTVKSHKHADMYSIMRALDNREVEVAQAQIETIYDRFVSIVAEGRGMTPADVDAIAQGRVWCGNEAIGIGLVNEIGGIKDAVEYAAIAAGVSDYRLVEYPVVKNSMTKLMEQLNGAAALASSFSANPEEAFMAMYKQALPEPGVYARLPYIYLYE